MIAFSRLAAVALALFAAFMNPAAAEEDTSSFGLLCPGPRLFDDLGGLRDRLGKSGIKLCATEIAEGFANLTGGLRRGVTFDGALQVQLGVDLGQYGLPGGMFYVSAWQLHGRGPSRSLVGNLQTVSGVEATNATRLDDIWFEQVFSPTLSLRLGQMRVDEEFLGHTDAGNLFLNSFFGFPGVTSLGLPSGGPVFPLGTPGVRIKYAPTENLTLLAGIFNGDPAGTGLVDPQRRNADGLRFRTRDGVMAFAEAQYSTTIAEQYGIYKIGGFFNSGRFPDQRFDSNGVSLAAPGSTGIPATRRGDAGFYLMADQTIWHSGGDAPQAVGLFARAVLTRRDRNPADLSLDAGITWKGPFGQTDDIAGLGVTYVRISDQLRLLDQDAARITPGLPIRSQETVFELTYVHQIRPGWLIQPDLQYIHRPGGGVVNPLAPTERLRSAVLLGLRTTLQF